MMSWLWRKSMTCLFLFTILSLTFSVEAANQIIIRRGYFDTTYAQDFFSYTDNNICGNESFVHKWCAVKNSYQLSNSPVSHRCSCQCLFKHETFLPMKKKCVKMKNSGIFDPGVYEFKVQVDFKAAGKAILFEQNNCHNCFISMTYFENDQWKSSSLQLSINNNCKLSWNSQHRELEGKILKIQFTQCTNRINQIVFLKSKGKYVIDLPTSSPTVASATISFSMDSTNTPTFTSSSMSNHVTPTRTTLKTSTQQVSEFVTSSHEVSPTKAIILSSYVCNSGGTVCPSSKSAAVPHPTMHPTNKINPDHQSSSSLSSTWTITVVVVACIVVGGIVALLVVLRRRNSRTRARSSGNSNKPPIPVDSTGNPMYGHNQGEVITLPNRLSQPQKVEDEEYDYATVDSGHSDPQKTSKPPLYQSLQVKENIRDSVYTPLNKEATETPVDYLYNHLQHPQYNPPRSKSDPLYNTLEPPNNDEYMKPETQISDNQPGGPEPVYNVLEGPDASPAPQDNDPVYNVLEGPDTNPVPQDNDPVYNVLEDPNANQYPQDNDPVYNILEGPDDDYDNAPSEDDENLPASGQDNVAYSSTIDLRKAQSPSSPDYDVLEGPEGALQDSTYQPLGVRAQDDMYQPLDRTSQPIYQSLEPNDSMA